MALFVKRHTDVAKIVGVALLAIGFITVGSIGFILHSQKANAITMDTSSFNPGRIIDDSVMYNATTMSAADIQNFLNSQVPACDTQGAQMISNGTQTRAAYSIAHGYNPPYTCLRDYSTTTNTEPADAYCSGYSSASQSAAQIIYGVAQSCGINPQVLLVLLQKEQGLVTDTWPWSIQYRSATGYGCPDTAACDSTYYGLFNQLYNAARQFKIYAAKPNSYTFKGGQTQTISYNPQASCGGSTIKIQNQATASLYNYTPYQPNTAALLQGAGTGTGDSCSSYGNMNFWIYFNNWFGAPTTTTVPGCSVATGTSVSCVWRLKKVSDNTEALTTSYSTMTNLLNSVGGYQYIGVAFYARNAAAPVATNIPIFSVNIGSEVFLTPSLAEYNSLKAAGNPDNGVAFYADQAGSNNGYQVYRLYNSKYGHVWSSVPTEIQGYLSKGYVSEGAAFTSLSPVRQEPVAPTGQTLVYRFNISGKLGHFWTTDVNERDAMIQSGYSYEGISWFGVQGTTSSPVYRLFSPALSVHLFTTDQNEKNVLSSQGWTYEGIAFYQAPAATARPVYRLYSYATYEHLFTTDSNERSILVRSGVYRDEGIAWYQPN